MTYRMTTETIHPKIQAHIDVMLKSLSNLGFQERQQDEVCAHYAPNHHVFVKGDFTVSVDVRRAEWMIMFLKDGKMSKELRAPVTGQYSQSFMAAMKQHVMAAKEA